MELKFKKTLNGKNLKGSQKAIKFTFSFPGLKDYQTLMTMHLCCGVIWLPKLARAPVQSKIVMNVMQNLPIKETLLQKCSRGI